MLSFFSNVTALRIIILILITFLLESWVSSNKVDKIAAENRLLEKKLEACALKMLDEKEHSNGSGSTTSSPKIRSKNIDDFYPEIENLISSIQQPNSIKIENQKLKTAISGLTQENNELKKKISSELSIKNLTEKNYI